jgi:uncharacterized protein
MPVDKAMLDFAAQRNLGTLATLKRDGRPQLSNVTFALDPGSAVVRISVTETRAKVRNLRRDPRASLLVSRQDGWTYVVLEGDVELTPVTQAADDATMQELVDVYREISGEHPDWDDYRRAMIADRRLVARLRVGHTYGLPFR